MRVGLIRNSGNDEALAAVRDHIGKGWGKEYLPAKPNIYKTAKAAQDAHEAIRPTDVELTPELLAPYLDKDMLALYSLVWKRFVASQMRPAVYDQTVIHVAAGRYLLKATGAIMRFPGFMALYVEAVDDNGTAEAENGATGRKAKTAAAEELTLPDVAAGETLRVADILPKQHFTQPLPRYNEATLVKALEENGVGRPSTYAAIISTIQEKEYVELRQRKFYPTDLGRLVNDLLVEHFPAIMNVEFTASLETSLDLIEEGKANWLTILKEFYGPFKASLEEAKGHMQSVKQQAIATDIPCALCGSRMMIRWGRRGEFLACEKYPDCKHSQNFTRDADNRIVAVEREEAEVSTETCEKCGKPMVFKDGRYGRFLACSGYPACKHVRAEGTDVKCPEPGCKGELVRKVSKRGKVFYSCNKFPKCTFALWDKPVNRVCPNCKAPYLVEKEDKKSGRSLRCVAKSCGHTEPLTGNEE